MNKTTTKQKCFLVCTAHLDPVWLWPWEEGLTEAISTYRVAADFLDQYPDFIFNHNESVLYEWVERNDPDLFRRIQNLVKKGRWHIAGGSYIQPDMIAASGESLIRQFLVGKRYFLDKFGVEPTTAYNFDSFGHPQGYVQILQGCGFDSYVFCRPHISVLPLPVGGFRWKHASGAEVVARRSDDHYITQGEIYNNFRDKDWGDYHKSEGDFMFLWGLGNHGGGPSHAEYADLKRLNKIRPELEFIESTPEAFFKHSLKQRGYENLPVVRGDFKPVQEGCYTSMQLVKRRHRQLENMMYLTEKLVTMAWWRKLRAYPTIDMSVAWKDILFAEFHDILPGSGIQKVEQDSINLLGHAEEILRRKKAEAMISLLGQEPLAERNETPIFVFNPHAWPVKQEIEIDFGIDRQFGTDGVERFLLQNGKVIPAQFEKGDDNLMNDSWGEWRSRVVFEATIPPLSYQRFDTDYKPIPKEKIRRWQSPKLPKGSRLTIKTKSLQVAINLKTGLLDGIKSKGKQVLFKGTGAPLVFSDINHSWSTPTKWTKPIARFKLATPKQALQIIGSDWTHKPFPKGKPPISILEDGPIRIIVEAIFVHSGSYLVQRYIVNKNRPIVHIEQVIFWNEHDKKLRLELIHDPALNKIEVEKAYSIDDETKDARSGVEKDMQHFLRLSARGREALAIISHGSHSYANRGGQLQMGILRSPGYGTHEHIVPADFDRYLNRYIPRQDQGIRNAKFTLLFAEQASSREAVAQASYEHNVPLEPFIYFPTKRQRKPKSRSFASVDAKNVLLTVIKKAEKGDALVLRLWETAGRKTKFKLTIEGRNFPLEIGGHQLKTYVLRGNGKLMESDMIERPRS
jgi:alpha-mannosidase